jgi:hypothetical protein
MGIEGIGRFGVHPIPNEEVIKQSKFDHIKTRAGKVAFVMLHGTETIGKMMNGINKSSGALKYVARVLEERTKG